MNAPAEAFGALESQMKAQNSKHSLLTGLLAAAMCAASATAGAADKPTLKDAYKDYFYVGAAINRGIATGTAFRRTPEQLNKDIALVKAQFSQVVAENDLKWSRVHPRPGADGYDFGPADAFVNFGGSNKLCLAGHTLVWHLQTPYWVFRGTNLPPETANASSPTPRASREQLLGRMRDHIHTVVGRYKGRIKVWDVVNEAVSDDGTNLLRNSPWLEIIGPDFIAKAFEFAHEADPDAILRYNDYGLEDPAKRRKLLALIKSLREQRVPVMAIGSQTHVTVSAPGFEEEDQALTDLETLGLPIHITELDVNSAAGGQLNTGADIANNAAAIRGGLVGDANRKLAAAYEGLFRAFVKHHKSVKMVTFWGVNDGVSWRAKGRPLLFDGNDQPKQPAFDAVIRAANRTLPNPR